MKIIGIGLNKTGTKTLRSYLKELGYRHQSYDLAMFNDYRANNLEKLFGVMENYDSFEDWPWPLMYKEIDKQFEDALFILTMRKSPERWYKSLCKMAVRMGPFNDFEKHIYGYAMPHGKKEDHINFYNKHNKEVKEYFKDRPNKLLVLCWENGDDPDKLLTFLGISNTTLTPKHVNKSAPVYEGETLWLAHINRVVYQAKWYTTRYFKSNIFLLKKEVKRLIGQDRYDRLKPR